MSTRPGTVKRHIHQLVSTSVMVDVDVEISPREMVRALTRDELIAECDRRGIDVERARASDGSERISRRELEEVCILLTRRNVPAALRALEWLLPQDFRGFTEEVERYFARRS